MKNKYRYLPLFFLLAVIAACSKATKDNAPVTTTTTTTTPPINTVPLPNTIDKTDTIKLMAYNVLNYGDLCQGPTSVLNGYLKTIIQYAQPDILSCEKMISFPVNSVYPVNLAADINDNALNAAFPSRYTFAPPTDISNDNKMSVLFYNQQKFGYVSSQTIVSYISDFNLYKLYYKDPNLSVTHDTTYLYVLVNHTQSGSSTTARDQQETQEMAALNAKFAYYPNLINMGDFNLRSSYEPGYQAMISKADTTRQLSDVPFYPDKTFAYPANWDVYPVNFSAYLTTSTRKLTNVPNSCGTSGGASSWYDHIFISPWLIKGTNYITYVPHSYTTIGNDGNRVDEDINSPVPVVNTSAPPAVIDALFQFSNKYPVTIKLVVKANRTAGSVPDPKERN
jgi:hypothetical protein